MENTGEQPSFEIKPTIEKTHLEDPAVQSLYGKWWEVHDDRIKPEFVNRQTWNARGGMAGLLDPQSEGRRTLFIPKDLHLWEMVGVMEAVDKDTFFDNPEKSTEAKDKILALGKVFEKAGIYIAQRMEFIDRGRKIAGNMAVQFYDYGNSLITGKRPEHPSSPELLQGLPAIPPDELEEVDKWIAGDNFYATKRKQLDEVLIAHPEQRDQLFEDVRCDALARYFRVSDRAFERQLRSDRGEIAPIDRSNLKPWESATPIHTGFIDKQNTQIQRAVEAPKRALEASVFRRGMELLRRNMPIDKLPDIVKQRLSFWEEGDKTLREALDIDRIKLKLESIRQEGDIDKLARVEENLAHEIQFAVANYPRKEGILGGNNPSQMITSQEINCTGASMLGGALLSELGIDYLVGDVPSHSTLFLITSSGKVKYLDMLYPEDNHELTDEVVSGGNNSKVTVDEIVKFSQNSKQTSLRFELLSEEYKSALESLNEGGTKISVYKPDLGHRKQVLGNTAKILALNGFADEAVEAGRSYLGLDPYNPDLRKAFAIILSLAGRNDEAVEAYRQAIAMDPNNNTLYGLLGNTLNRLHKGEEAIETYLQAIILNPDDPTNTDVYFSLGENLAVTGRYKEAIENLEKFIKLANPKEDKGRLEYARSVLDQLKEPDEE